jgi:outer membrane protein assembly factor BamB
MRSATTYILLLLAGSGCATGAAVQDKPAEAAMNVAWQKEIEIAGAAHLAIGLRAVVVAGAESGLSAYALDDGRPLWRSEKTSLVQPVITGGLVVIATSEAVEALSEETGTTAWHTRIEANALPPTLHATAQLVVLVRGTQIQAWGSGGSPAWQKILPSVPTTNVVAVSGSLLIGLRTPEIAALSAATGEIQWSAEVPAPPTALTLVEDRLYAPATDGRLSAYRIDSGLKLQWRYRAVPAIGVAIVDEERVYFTLIDNTVRALDRDDGAQRASFPLSSRPVGGAILVASTLFVPLSDGDLARIPVAPGTKPETAKPATNTSVRLSAAAMSEDRVYAIVTPENGATSLTAWRIAR